MVSLYIVRKRVLQSLSQSNASNSDEDLARIFFAEEAQALLTIAKDHIVNDPDQTDYREHSLLEELEAIERMAQQDREMAIAFAEGQEQPPERLADALASPSNSDSTQQTTVEVDDGTSNSQTCVSCGDRIEGPAIHAPCGHAFDIVCLQRMFRLATVDESTFPPRCCQTPIPYDDIHEHLDSDFARLYQQKSIEFGVIDRLYCHRLNCSSFLGPRTKDAIPVTCVKCLSHTCGSCKGKAHPNDDCSVVLEQLVLDLGKKSGWQSCPACGHLIELSVGCHHITCICKKQFCYLCGVTWKECSCPAFAEERL
ncbi:hypothetical protein AcW1_000426 [Taiwanofungus camphoratus]|nr:hypothetical protein AcV5_004327 [Antrodia cinnamomea]KAI0961312.1 hypothetical protein AcV7_000446 [Antrodia cinnamomea]KAI0963319.1 hypothetical protein AcW1_000426 [Antrodia cinnamomea]